jgi:hypothetical protein
MWRGPSRLLRRAPASGEGDRRRGPRHLASAACAYAEALRGGHASTSIVHAPVAEFDYTGVTVVYLFHPLGPQTLGMAMAKLKLACEDRGAPIRIAYLNPVHNPVHEAVLREQSWLVEAERWKPLRFFGQRNAVSLWSSVDSVSQQLVRPLS